MIEGIRVYVEGGGERSHTKARLRQGFSVFFRGLQEACRAKHLRWDIIMSGSRNSCYDDFCNALVSHPGSFNVLLVDSECLVRVPASDHLRDRDHWSITVSEEHCHLMAQTMEAWLIADIDALSMYYGYGFLRNAIPRSYNVEDIDKPSLEDSLEHATRGTQKGSYRKIRHAADLLRRISPIIVRNKASHCQRFFQTIHRVVDSNSTA